MRKESEMFYNISVIVGIILNFIAIGSNILICIVNDENKWSGQMKIISTQCRWIGLVYIALAWFVGNGEIVFDGRDTYAQIAHWMQIFCIGWIIVFVVTLLSKLWNKNENLSDKALAFSLLYFVVAYLIH